MHWSAWLRSARDALCLLAAMGAVCQSAGAHEGSLGSEAMWVACEGRQREDACSFQNQAHDVCRGTWQAMSNALVCVRNQPILDADPSAASHRHADDPAPPPQAARAWPWLAGAALLFAGGYGLFRRRRKTAA